VPRRRYLRLVLRFQRESRIPQAGRFACEDLGLLDRGFAEIDFEVSTRSAGRCFFGPFFCAVTEAQQQKIAMAGRYVSVYDVASIVRTAAQSGSAVVARKNRGKRPPGRPVESQAAWTLCVMTTVIFSGLAAVGWLAVRNRPDNGTMLAFVELLHFSSVVTGLVSLLLLPLVFKVRREPPPPAFVAFAIIVAALPILAVLL